MIRICLLLCIQLIPNVNKKSKKRYKKFWIYIDKNIENTRNFLKDKNMICKIAGINFYCLQNNNIKAYTSYFESLLKLFYKF